MHSTLVNGVTVETRCTARTTYVLPPRIGSLTLALMIGLGLLAAAHGARAADTTSATGGSGLPWESPLNVLQESFTGPVAFIISLLGIIMGGATLIWGGEISEFARRMIYLVLVIAILVFANTLLTGALFSGAMVPPGGLG